MHERKSEEHAKQEVPGAFGLLPVKEFRKFIPLRHLLRRSFNWGTGSFLGVLVKKVQKLFPENISFPALSYPSWWLVEILLF